MRSRTNTLPRLSIALNGSRADRQRGQVFIGNDEITAKRPDDIRKLRF